VLALTLIHWKESFDRTQNMFPGQRRLQMVPNSVLIDSNPVLRKFFHEIVEVKEWTSFDKMFPMEEQEEAARQAARGNRITSSTSSTSAGAASSSMFTDDTTAGDVSTLGEYVDAKEEEEEETPKIQTEEEIQQMIATHMKSAMKGRMNLKTRGSFRQEAVVHRRGREVEDAEEEEEEQESGDIAFENNMMRGEKGKMMTTNDHQEVVSSSSSSSSVVHGLTHQLKEQCLSDDHGNVGVDDDEEEEDEDSFEDAVEGHDSIFQHEQKGESTPVTSTSVPVPPPRPTGGRALPSIPPPASANASVASAPGSRKPLPPTPDQSR
jgi:hypothetical protein